MAQPEGKGVCKLRIHLIAHVKHASRVVDSEYMKSNEDHKKGHDYYMYARIQRQAQLHELHDLEHYFVDEKYLEAIRITRTVEETEANDGTGVKGFQAVDIGEAG